MLDLRSLTWSKVEAKVEMESLESSSPVPLAPCAGHSLVCIEWMFQLFELLDNELFAYLCPISTFIS